MTREEKGQEEGGGREQEKDGLGKGWWRKNRKPL